jgi:hypothetical protein
MSSSIGTEDDSYDSVQTETVNFLYTMDSDQLLSAMTLADRDNRNDDFVRYRRELMYRLHCAEPLINWYPPTRMNTLQRPEPQEPVGFKK